MKKVLQVLAIKPKGGVGTFLKNVYGENFPYHFDIVESGNEIGGSFDEHFISRGSNIFLFPEIKYKNILKYFFKCRDFYRENANKYSAIHIHSTAIAYFHLYFAKKHGIKCRIFHSHGNFANENSIKRIINKFFLSKILKYSTNYCACGQGAGKVLLGNRVFTVIPNGIDVNKFEFNGNLRNDYRKKLGIENKFVIGVVGRFDKNKNQSFVLEIANKLKENKNIHFLFLGDGETLESCKNSSIENGLENTTFLGKVDNVFEYYNAMDLLLMTSYKEGFSLVAIEGQCNGLPIIFSNTLDRDMKILEDSIFLPIESEEIRTWSGNIENFKVNLDSRKNAALEVRDKYSLENSRKILKDFYDDLI